MKLGRQKIKYVPTDSLRAMERPLKKHDDVERLIESFNQFGWTIPILVQRGTNRIVAGHGRWLAARREGLKQVPVIFKDFDDKQANAYAIVDNQLTEISPWDPVNLEHHVANLEKQGYDLGWTGLDITKTPGGAPIKEDVPPEKSSAPPKSKPGQIYALGAHRLMCGDATRGEDVARLMMGGGQADMVFTDPPYGIDYDDKKWVTARPQKTAKSKHRNRFGKIQGDAEEYDPTELLCLFEGCKEIFIFGANHFHQNIPTGGAWMVWDRKTPSQESTPHCDFEICWSKAKHKATMVRILWGGYQNKEKGEARFHPTQKPVALAAWFFERWGKEQDSVVDLYGGSGTTLIACEQMKRICRMAEISPAYADVIRRRYHAFMNDGEEKGWQEGTPAMTGLA